MSTWTTNVIPDPNRPGTVKIHARNGCRVVQLDRINTADADRIDFERAWKREPYLLERAS